MPRSEMLLAFNELLDERELPPEMIAEALKQAIAAAYRKATGAPSSQKIDVVFDLPKGRYRILAEKEVVAEVQDPRLEISLAEARKTHPEAQIGDLIMVDVTPAEFGRIAAQTARQVLKQRLSEFERKMQYDFYSQLVGEIVAGVVQAVHPQEIVVGLEKRAEGHLPRKEQIPGERYQVHDRIRALILKVEPTSKGPYILLSRAHPNFLRRLLEEEVPEIYRGEVEIKAIAREAGRRSKVAVAAVVPNVDPVGACVGMRGTRIQAIMRELNNERIDIIAWDPDPATFITKALSPARVLRVYVSPNPPGSIPKGTATVVVHESELSQAIGKEGQNVRLAAKLTRWRIDIKSVTEAVEDALTQVLAQRRDYPWVTDEMLEQVHILLQKKQEGRPLLPEEYDVLLNFLDTVEAHKQEAEARRRQRQAEEEALRASIPAVAFERPLDVLDLPPRVVLTLTQAGYTTVGDLMLQLKRNPDEILALNGIGPRVMETIRQALETFEAEVVAAQAEAEAPEPEAAAEPVAAETPESMEAATAVDEAPAEAPVEEAAAPEEAPAAEAVEETAEAAAAPATEPSPEAEAMAPSAAAQEPEPSPEPEPATVAEPEAEPEPEPEPSLDDLFDADRFLRQLGIREEQPKETPVAEEKPKKKRKKKARPPRAREEDWEDWDA